jgi:hypothetical protein
LNVAECTHAEQGVCQLMMAMFQLHGKTYPVHCLTSALAWMVPDKLDQDVSKIFYVLNIFWAVVIVIIIWWFHIDAGCLLGCEYNLFKTLTSWASSLEISLSENNLVRQTV